MTRIDPRLGASRRRRGDRRDQRLSSCVCARCRAAGASSRVVEARLIVNGELRASAEAPCDFSDRVQAAARIVAAVGERLQAGDRIITGSVVQVGLEPGDEVIAELGALGRLRLVIAT
jgi:2-keto-4-pentenoate hydratase